jgi:tripartite-type tricarboxylate transporter receptor subunit TctC
VCLGLIKKYKGDIYFMKKKVLSLVAMGLAVVMLAACTAPQPAQQPAAPAATPAPAAPAPGGQPDPAPAEPTTDFPGNATITMIVPWAPGGGSDLGARIVQQHLEDYLGATIIITNPTGATGWLGWEQMLAADADGLTVSLVNFPALFSGYLDPSLGRTRDLDDFHFVANHVSDKMMLAARADDNRFATVEDFVAYATDTDILFGTTGVGTQGHMTFEIIREEMGLQMTMIPFNGAADVLAALLGGHIDIATISVGETLGPLDNGDINPFITLADERSTFIPDIRTWNEVYPGNPHTMSSQRGFALRADTPAEIVAVWESAFEYALNHPDAVERMTELGLYVDFMTGAEYNGVIREFEQLVISLSEFMGW